MQSEDPKKKDLFLLMLILISTHFISVVFIQFFSNNETSELNTYEHSVPLTSSLNSELEMIWNYTYGEYKDETIKSLIRLPNGNYVISGYLNVSDNFDIMVRCFLSNGTSLWNKTFGYEEDDYGFQVIPCISSGIAVVGRITNTTALFDNNDAILIRIAANGTHLWNETYSGPEQTPTSIKDDRVYSVVECTNGDFVLAGVTTITNEGSNVWMFRVNSTGYLLWNKTYHNWDIDRCFEPHCLVQNKDGGFTIAGYTFNSTQSNDVWLIRTNPAGNVIWNHTYGAIDEYQRPNGLVECASGGFGIIAANKTSGGLYTDAWIIRTNASGEEIWNQTYGGEESDTASQIMEMSDGGFTFVGATHSYDIGQGDIWFVHTYANGSIKWNHTIATPYGENGVSFVYEGNGTYTIAGHHNPVGMPGSVMWLLKVRISIIPPGNGSPGNGDGSFLWLFIIIIPIIAVISVLTFWLVKSKRSSAVKEP
ncbi:MAG: hypothetical protein ACFFCC_19655 [Promethearchaeota archaeon]